MTKEKVLERKNGLEDSRKAIMNDITRLTNDVKKANRMIEDLVKKHNDQVAKINECDYWLKDLDSKKPVKEKKK
jgi:flagellar capping protein FliD